MLRKFKRCIIAVSRKHFRPGFCSMYYKFLTLLTVIILVMLSLSWYYCGRLGCQKTTPGYYQCRFVDVSSSIQASKDSNPDAAIKCETSGNDRLCLTDSVAHMCNESNATCYYTFYDQHKTTMQVALGFDKVTIPTDVFKVECQDSTNAKNWESLMAGISQRSSLDFQDSKSVLKTANSINFLNVSVLAWDIGPVSALEFSRFLPLTSQYLDEELRAFIFKKYNSLHVPSNMNSLYPVLTGKTEEEWNRSQGKSLEKDIDSIPFVWKAFANHGYITAFADDTELWTDTRMGQHQHLDFLEKPTHHYLGPLYNELSKDLSKWNPFCLGDVPRHKAPTETLSMSAFAGCEMFITTFHKCFGDLKILRYDTLSPTALKDEIKLVAYWDLLDPLSRKNVPICPIGAGNTWAILLFADQMSHSLAYLMSTYFNGGEHSIHRHQEYLVLMNWVSRFLDSYRGHNKFAFIAHRELAESGKLHLLDADMKEFLKNLKESGHLDETLILLFSDNGARPWTLGDSQQAKLEENWPILNIVLPLWVESSYTDSTTSLQVNTERLMTQYDIHATLLGVLDFVEWRVGHRSQRGISLFDEIPAHRRCEDCGLPSSVCLCLNDVAVSTWSFTVSRAAEAVVQLMNMKTEPYRAKCHTLMLDSVTWARKQSLNSELLRGREPGKRFFGLFNALRVVDGEEEYYQLKIRTTPGQRHYMATVRHLISEDKFETDVKNILRADNPDDIIDECIFTDNFDLRDICYCEDV